MSTRQRKSGVSASSAKKVAKRATKKTETALAPVTDRLHARGRLQRARATLKKSPGRAKRFLTSTPVRVLLGASAVGFVLAKLKQHLA